MIIVIMTEGEREEWSKRRRGVKVGLGMQCEVGCGGGVDTLGGMLPAMEAHNAPSVQAGPQELVLQQGRGSHQ